MTPQNTNPDNGIRELLAETYPTGECPDAGQLLEALEGRLADASTARVRAHVDRCSACQAEWRLAKEFVDPSGGSRTEDLDRVNARLESVRPWHSETRAEPVHRTRWQIPLALAATVLLTLGGLRLLDSGPGLPDVPEGDVMRGTWIDIVAPRGDVAGTPDSLRWVESGDARRYRVTIRAVDDTVLWQADVDGSPATVPATIRSRLNPAVTYYWDVTAYADPDAAATEVQARSDTVGFRIAP